MFYDNLKAICSEKNTNITTLLKEIGKSTGLTGSWKAGRLPNLEILMLMAKHLDVSLDYLVYGIPANTDLSNEEVDLLNIYKKIPSERRPMCKAFLETHVVNSPEKKNIKEA